jgi:hypothetical protein
LILFSLFAIAMMALAVVNSYLAARVDGLSVLVLANVEALAQSEQPDIGTCIWIDEWVKCIALHPTDSSKDKETPWGWD